MDQAELFIAATNAYKDWWMCNRDFALHADVWDKWDDAILAYMAEANLNRIEAINQIRKVLGMGGLS